MLAIVFAPRGVIPFNTKPCACGAGNLANILHGAEHTVVRPSLADLSSGRHFFSSNKLETGQGQKWWATALETGKRAVQMRRAYLA